MLNRKKRVYLDAGHNYKAPDTGAVGFGLREQDVTFQVANTIRVLLEFHGVEVGMSRWNLTDILGRTVSESLQLRTQGSNRFNADYFVSIHCNAFNGSAFGTETYIFARGGKREELASRIHRQLVGIGLRDRGVKTANFAVLRNTKAPAVLVELAFIDNMNDNDILRNRQFELAEAVAKGICEQFGITYQGGEGAMFKDVQGHWAERQINELREFGIVNGDETGNFRPNDAATRAEVATMIRNVVRYITGE
ncbi:MAG: N-acetylmuramoyl-L-alanine amidase [Oscillospiraceae bacterium]|nr:N-acetylmuramoyl-L-alanine amidase [Oscillospiraceae bacterium]